MWSMEIVRMTTKKSHRIASTVDHWSEHAAACRVRAVPYRSTTHLDYWK
jgi:hypothetical protein